jgi:hypothetical protein
MEGTWMATMNRSQIEAVAGFATYPIVSLLTIVQALRANLDALAARMGEPMDELPVGRATVAEFKQIVGWGELEARQAHYELGSTVPSTS